MATDKESEYVIPIAFTWQKRVDKSTSVLPYSTILPLLLHRKTLKKKLKLKKKTFLVPYDSNIKLYSFCLVVILWIKTKRCQNSEDNPNLPSAVNLKK